MLWALVVLGVSAAAPAEAAEARDPFAAVLRPAGPGKAVEADAAEAAGRARAQADAASKRFAAASGEAEARAAAAACTAAYVAAYNEHRLLDRRGDELLFNAAACAAGHAPGAALRLWRVVVERYPRSELAPRASLRSGRLAFAVGLYARAAEDFERLVRMAPKQAEARDVLYDAMAIRAGLEQWSEARADWALLLRMYGGEDPGRAAEVQMAGWQLARDDAERLKLVEAYLQGYARAGGVDRTIVASVEAGRLLWRRACAQRGVDGPPGLCVTGWTAQAGPAQAKAGPAQAKAGAPAQAEAGAPAQVKAGAPAQAKAGAAAQAEAGAAAQAEARTPAQAKAGAAAQAEAGAPVAVQQGRARVCAAAASEQFSLHARDARLVAAAREHFARARALERAVEVDKLEDPRRAVALREATALVRRLEADAELEALMAIETPALRWPLSRGRARTAREREVERASMQAFNAFYQALTRQAEVVRRRLEEVVTARVAEQSLAAAGRRAALERTMAARLLALRVPKGLTPAVEAAYCAALGEQAAPWLVEAERALEYCVQRAAEFLVFTPEARACEAELGRRASTRYPRLAEFVPASAVVEWEPEPASVVLDAPDAAVGDPGEASAGATSR